LIAPLLLSTSRNMIVYHYTDIANLEKIICKNTERKPELIFRATNCKFLNDGTENTLGIKIVSQFLALVEDDLNIKQEDRISPILNIPGYINRIYQHQKAFDDHNPSTDNYIISFSCDKDSLVMWSMYGNKGDGVAIGVDDSFLTTSYNNGFNTYKQKCTYWPQHTLTELNESISPELFESIKENYILMTNNSVKESFAGLSKVNKEEMVFRYKRFILLNLVTFYSIFHKLDMWSNENEFRFSTAGFGPIVKYYKNAKGVYVPYINVSFAIDALREVVIGPTCGRNSYGMVKSLMYERGMLSIPIVTESQCPLQ